MQMKRIKESFFESDETIQMNVLQKTQEITQLIKQSEAKLKELSRLDDSVESKSDRQIRKNMQSILAERLKDVTFELRRSEKEHFAKVQEIHGGNTIRETDELEQTKESGENVLLEDEYVHQS